MDSNISLNKLLPLEYIYIIDFLFKYQFRDDEFIRNYQFIRIRHL